MAKKPSRPPTARAARRELARDARKDVRERQRLAALLPGAVPDRAIEIASPAVVELRAQAEPCPLCGGNQTCDEHAAVVIGGEPLREARLSCRLCHARRSVWFRIAPDRPN